MTSVSKLTTHMAVINFLLTVVAILFSNTNWKPDFNLTFCAGTAECEVERCTRMIMIAFLLFQVRFHCRYARFQIVGDQARLLLILKH